MIHELASFSKDLARVHKHLTLCTLIVFQAVRFWLDASELIDAKS